MSAAAYLNNNARTPAILCDPRAALNRRGASEIYLRQDRTGRARGGPAGQM